MQFHLTVARTVPHGRDGQQRAARNFLNALLHIPAVIERYEKDNARLQVDVPLLQSIVGKQWKKEHELRELKGQLQELDKKIQAELSKNEPKAVEKQDEHAPDIRQEPRPKGDTNAHQRDCTSDVLQREPRHSAPALLKNRKSI